MELEVERVEISNIALTKEKQREIRLRLQPMQAELDKIAENQKALETEKAKAKALQETSTDDSVKDLVMLTLERNQVALERLAKEKEKLEADMGALRTNTQASEVAVDEMRNLVAGLQEEVMNQGLDRRIDHFGLKVHEAIVKNLMLEKRFDERLIGLYAKTKFERLLSSPLFCKATAECKKPAGDRERVKLDDLYFSPAGTRGSNAEVVPAH